MQDRMLAVLDFIGMKMPIDWYGWQQFFPEKCSGQREGSEDKVPDARPYPGSNVHDGVYPALPALEAFSSACQTLFEAGGYVKPFVPARIFDPGLNENGPFAAQAKPNVLQRRVTDGGKIRWAYNKAYWLMCYNTPWWQQRLKEQAVTLLDKEKAHGMYFDTFYGGRPQCFSTKHGHSHGGGNDSYLAAVKHSQAVWGGMKQADPESVGTGEKCAETAINLLDGLLLNWPVWPDMAPLWAAVYGDYSRWSGNFLAPESDGYYIQATALFAEGGQMGRLRFQSNYDDWMKDFDAGSPHTEKMKFLRKLCHYWKPNVGVRFLAYGQLMRPLPLAQGGSMPTFSYNETSRYVSGYKKGLITVPALMNGVFKTHDGDLGVFIVNVIDKPVEYNFELTADKYPISKSAPYNVTPIDETGSRGKTTVHTGKITYSGKIAGRDVLFLEIKEQKAR